MWVVEKLCCNPVLKTILLKKSLNIKTIYELQLFQMKKILLLSDTHSYIDNQILKFVKQADEVWHAGDIGNIEVIDQIKKIKPVRAVFGNIDDSVVRSTIKEENTISKAKKALKDKMNLDVYIKSLENDIRLNGEENYKDYSIEDFIEDYDNYTQNKTELDEAFVRQMKYKAGIIK